MQISVSGQNLKVGDALRGTVEKRLKKNVAKYFENAIDAEVRFSKEAHLFVADVLVNEGSGSNIVIKSEAKADDIYAAFETAADRVEKQLRRYKRRLKSRSSQQRQAEREANFEAVSQATKYVISEDGQEEEAEEDNPLIIAEKQLVIENLTVGDAVMRMNLANLPALMFINKKTGGVSMVYRRNDGNISWVDSTLSVEQASKNAA